MRRLDLVADCGACAALCCIALPFDASEDFAFHKDSGVACRHLEGRTCTIHEQLVDRGFPGCAVYDCYGAGPRAMREAPERRHDAFLALRDLHELLFLLTEAARICPRQDLAQEIDELLRVLDRLADLPRTLHARGHALLRRVGEALGRRGRLRVRTVR